MTMVTASGKHQRKGSVKASRIRVLVVDDNEMLRNSLSLFLDVFDDLTLVGQAQSGGEALTQCMRLQPDIMLTSLRLPDMKGIDLTRIITQRYPHIKVIVMSSSEQQEDMEASLKAGARSYLLKGVDIDEMAQAIRAAAL